LDGGSALVAFGFRLELAKGIGRQGWEATLGWLSTRGALFGLAPSGVGSRERVSPQAREAGSETEAEGESSPLRVVTLEIDLRAGSQAGPGRLGREVSGLLGASSDRGRRADVLAPGSGDGLRAGCLPSWARPQVANGLLGAG
jgi:hypothetical protein